MGAGSNVIRKFLVTLAFGGVAYLLTILTKQPAIWSLTMSIFIGGVSLVVQFLVDVDARVGALDGRFTTVNRATELFGDVNARELKTDAVIELVETASAVAALERPMLTRFANAEIERLTRILRQLASNPSINEPGDEADWLLTLTANTDQSMRATTMIGPRSVDEAFWQTPLAATYIETQREAIQRNVRIQRLFIIPRNQPMGAEVEDLIQENLDLGIEVRVYRDPPALDVLEFVVFDAEICQEFPVRRGSNSGDTFFVKTELQTDPKVVARRIRQFDYWWRVAEVRPLPPAPPDLELDAAA
jgi:hypothetical protein